MMDETTNHEEKLETTHEEKPDMRPCCFRCEVDERGRAVLSSDGTVTVGDVEDHAAVMAAVWPYFPPVPAGFRRVTISVNYDRGQGRAIWSVRDVGSSADLHG